jgi:cell wall-associated NlpC family hydrolase
VSKRQALGRHRATPVRTNPLETISKAVASNAGSVGRQAAVIAAASGLVLTLGVPAQATPNVREAAAAPVDTLAAERVAVKAVAVPATVVDKYEIDRAALKSTPAPEPEPVVATVANTASETARQSSRDLAPTTRSNVATTAAATAAPKKAVAKTAVSANLSGIAAIAAQYEGVPYVWGGSSPSGWDCSGFVKYVYGKAGINVARGTSALLGSGQFVRTSNPKPGDLVFQNGGGHVGIYLGNGTMIGAQNPTVDTMIHSVTRNPLYGYYTLAK